MPDTPPQKTTGALSLPVAIVVSAVVIAGAIVVTRGVSAPLGAAVDAAGTISIRPPGASDHVLGNADAPVVIVEYADFQCPYCSMIYPTLKSAVTSSGGKVAWVYRNFPLDSIHPNARPAAEAAECIAAELGNDAFWKFADADFADQQALGHAFYTQEAATLGANSQTFADCVAKKQYDDRISADETEAIQNGGQGTPFTIVVGRDGTKIPFSGALPADQINAIIHTVLSKQSA